MSKEKAQLYLDRAKIKLMGESNNTFYLSILFGLKIEWDKAMSGGMIATDGIHLYINPEYFLKRNYDGIKADLYHEVCHIFLGHIGFPQKNNLDPQKFNIAADYYINLQLTDAGTYLDDTFIFENKYRDWSIKAIYDDLPAQPPKNFNPDIKNNGNLPKEEQDAKETEIKNLISRAVVQAQMANDYGSLPADLQRHIQELLSPTLPWETLLANFFSSYSKEDYSYRRPNRRSFDEDVTMPSLYSESMGELSIYIDCSGSISDKQYKEFLEEVQGIIDTIHPSCTTVTNWGSNLGESVKVYPDEFLLDKCKLQMLGGTEILKPLKHIKKTEPEVAVIFTDLYVDRGYKSMKPDCEVLWVVVDNPNKEAEFGTTIHL